MKFKEYIKFKNYIILLYIAIVILAHLGTIRGRSGVDPGGIRGRFLWTLVQEMCLSKTGWAFPAGSIRGRSGVDPGQLRGNSGVDPGQLRGGSGATPGGIRGRSGATPGQIRGRFVADPGGIFWRSRYFLVEFACISVFPAAGARF